MRFSASRFILYADCSLKYKFNYIDALRVPAKSVHLAYGSAVHKGLETLNIALKEGKDYHIEDICQAFDDSYSKELADMGLDKSVYYGYDLYEHGINTIVKYCETMIDYEVIDTEMEFTVPILRADGTQIKDHTLYGLIDVILRRKKENKIMIVDYKTAKEQYNQFKLKTSLQLAIYAFAVRWLLKEGKIQGFGKKLEEDFISYYVLLKDYETRNGPIKMQRMKITSTHLNRMHYILEKSIEGIENEIFVPNYNSQCHWCEYKKNCVEFEG